MPTTPDSTPSSSRRAELRLELSRRVRVQLCGPDSAEAPVNGLVGVGPASGLWPVGEVEVVCGGIPDETGYLVDIGDIDRAVRDLVVPPLLAAARAELLGTARANLGSLLASALKPLGDRLRARIARISYRPSPFRSLTVEPTMPGTVLLSETFEFAASHRLHLSGRSDDENAQLFGKCNNPNGHGHNYRIEVAVRVEAGADTPPACGFAAIEAIVRDEIMARFDHRNLNLDCPEFAGLNPSVEHIALVAFGVLSGPIARAGGQLDHVRVWETDKTSCRYPA